LLLVVVAVRPVLPALVAVLVTAGPAPVFAQAVPADFAITLERTQCFGTCPAYSVRIDAAGNVTYEGTHFVRVEGLQTDRVPVSAAAALLATVQRIGFFDLADQYREITNPDGTVTTMTDQRTTFVSMLATVHIENTIVDLDIAGEGAVTTLIREVQKHAHRPVVLHVDFYQIHAGEKLTVNIPVHFVGTAPGVKEGGMLQHTLDEIAVRCLPAEIPTHFDVDISSLEIGDSVHVSAVVLPANVELLEDPERTICSVLPPTVVKDDEEAEEAVEAAPDGEPEVIGRGKEDEDEGEA
jgi:large subunit ribosomal protein L25